MSPVDRMFLIIEKQNKTIQSLCSYLEVSSSIVANWKKRSEYPPAKYIPGICTFLNISSDYLLGIENLDCADEGAELLKLFHSLNDDRRKNLLEVAKGLLATQEDSNENLTDVG